MWCKMRDDFDRDPSMPNPYEEVERRMFFFFIPAVSPLTRFLDFTMAQLRLELLREEEKHASASPLSAEDRQSQKPSPVMFFRKAIEIEDRL